MPQYEGRIRCIYIDPPYNTAHSTDDNRRWVYNDNVDSREIMRWIGKTAGDEGEDLSRHDKWLCMMYPRLKLLQRLLSEDGIIFISINDAEHARLKLICDEIFGANNFVYATQHTSPLLNSSYVLTCSNDFFSTLGSIIAGLNNAGFSKRDARIADAPLPAPVAEAPGVQTEIEPITGDDDGLDDIDTSEIKAALERDPAQQNATHWGGAWKYAESKCSPITVCRRSIQAEDPAVLH